MRAFGKISCVFELYRSVGFSHVEVCVENIVSTWKTSQLFQQFVCFLWLVITYYRGIAIIEQSPSSRIILKIIWWVNLHYCHLKCFNKYHSSLKSVVDRLFIGNYFDGFMVTVKVIIHRSKLLFWFLWMVIWLLCNKRFIIWSVVTQITGC